MLALDLSRLYLLPRLIDGLSALKSALDSLFSWDSDED